MAFFPGALVLLCLQCFSATHTFNVLLTAGCPVALQVWEAAYCYALHTVMYCSRERSCCLMARRCCWRCSIRA